MHPLQKILKEILDAGEMDYSIRSYSGRFMYGEECLAIDGDDINLLKLGYLIKAFDEDNEIIPYNLNQIRRDSMGLGIVVYFPDIGYTNDEDELVEDEP